MSGYGGVVVMGYIKYMSLELFENAILCLSHILYAAMVTSDDIDWVGALAVYMLHAVEFSVVGSRFEYPRFVN